MANRHRRLSLILLLALACSGCASDPAAQTNEQHSNRTSEVHEPIALGRFFESDVVIVIDQSTLALLASGIDVDNDGVVGRNREWVGREQITPSAPGWSWTTDSDDTVEALQRELASSLVGRLAERGNRIGLASFALRAALRGTSIVRYYDKPHILVPVGPPDRVLAALEDFPSIQEQRRTDLARLLPLAAELLDEASKSAPTRPRAILLLTVGGPTAPDGLHWASRRAIETARGLGERDIEIWAIPLGDTDVHYLRELTESSGGGVVALDQLDSLFAAIEPRTRSSQQANE
jgi:hypothetical protein